VALSPRPYLESGQSLVVNRVRTPQNPFGSTTSAGKVVGIQVGNTSDGRRRDLKAEGKLADIRYYPYGGIRRPRRPRGREDRRFIEVVAW